MQLILTSTYFRLRVKAIFFNFKSADFSFLTDLQILLEIETTMPYITNAEMFLHCFLFLQVAMQANVPQPSNDEDETDDVDEDLKKLQISLEGGSGGSGWGDVTEDPSIADYLQYYKYVIGF